MILIGKMLFAFMRMYRRETAQMNIFDFMNPFADDQIDGQMDIKEFMKG